MEMVILLVDDEPLQLTRLKSAVEATLPQGSEILSYTNSVQAYGDCKSRAIDLAFLDIKMPGYDGLQLAKKLKMLNPRVRIVFVTAYDEYALEAFRLHASGYISKPVTKEKIEEELSQIGEPRALPANKPLQVKCFGNFEIFHNGQPVKFMRSKSKELLAYLIDREGEVVSNHELSAVLWEEDYPSYLRNLIGDIRQSLAEIGCEDVFIKHHQGCSVDVTKFDCDAYEFKNNNPEAIRMFRGQYMAQYSWAMFADD